MRQMFTGVALIALGACSPGAGSVALATRADSAGIEIVTSPGPAWRAGEGWRIDPEPIVQIGHRADDDPHYDLFRLGAVRELSDGGILAIVAGHSELRYFDSAGTWVRSFGRAGDGPGEMRNPASLAMTGDSIFLVDMGLQRTNTYLTNGDFVQSAPFPTTEAGRRMRPIWRLDDGTWIGIIQVSPPGRSSEGHFRDSLEYHRLTPDLARVDGRIAAVPGPEMYGTINNLGDGRIQSMMMMLPLARSSTSKPSGTSIVTGENSRPQLSIYTAGGTLERILRWAAPLVPVEPALLDRMKTTRLEEVAGNEAAERSIVMQFATPGLADAVPYFTTMQIDPTGAIWLQQYPLSTGDSLRYIIFDSTGQWLGALTLPPRHTVQSISESRILTVWRDADDLEYIRVYRLRR